MNFISENQYSGAVWGSESCWLRMPGYYVQFRGITEIQKQSLSNQFNDFLLGDKTSIHPSSPTLICDVYQLANKLDVPSSELDDQGQYSPIQIRDSKQLKIIGYNFVTSFSIESGNKSFASLGVFQEHQFAQSIVVENFLRFYTAHFAVEQSGAILHSAGIVVDGHAIVLPGYSNVGKTTITKKANENGFSVLSDDINLVLPTASSYAAHKVPFTGEFGKKTDQKEILDSYPIRMIALLEQSDTVKVEEISSSTAISRLMTASPFVNNDDFQIPRLLKIYADMVTDISVVKLSLTRDCKFDEVLKQINF